MKNLGKVFAFEFKTYIRKKSFIVTTIALIIASLLVTSIPTFINIFTGGRGVDLGGLSTKEVNAVYAADSSIENYFKNNSEPNSFEYYGDEKELIKDVENGKVKKGFVINSDRSLTYYTIDTGVRDNTVTQVVDLLKLYSRDESLIKNGIDPKVVDEASNVEIVIDNKILGKDTMTSFTTVYAAMITTYMLVILYGSIIATSVAREKSDRTMELLITSTSPTSLIVGKVFAAAVVGVIQITLIYLSVYLGLLANIGSYPDGFLKMIGLTITWDGLLVLLLFTALGFLMYLFLFAGLGALVSKVEDVSTSISPVTFIFIAVYFATNLAINMPDSVISRFASIIPLSSPMAMFARYSLVSVPVFELMLSLALLVATTLLLAYISIKIYRLGTLNYGNRVKIFKAIKSVFEKQ